MTASVFWRCTACGGMRLHVDDDSIFCEACGERRVRDGGIWTSDQRVAAERFDAAAVARLTALDERDHFWTRERQALLERLVDRLPASHGRVAELGCGGGGMLASWRARFGTVVGVDAHRALLDRARSRTPDAVLIEADARATPLASDQFDVVAALDVIEHVEPDALLAEARRIAAPEGRLLISAPAAPSLWSAMDEHAGHRCRYTARLLRQELRRNGWRWDGDTHFQCALFPLVYATRRLTGGAASVERRPPRLVDRALGLVNRSEVALARWCRMPFGSSVVAWATRA